MLAGNDFSERGVDWCNHAPLVFQIEPELAEFSVLAGPS
jgi:hypothetical protein